MILQLIRNATLRLDYARQTILIDPYFAPQFSLPSYTGKSPNPLVELPLPIDDILKDVSLVIVSHLHSDHFDTVAHQQVPKNLPLFCQPGNEDFIREKGFQAVTPIGDEKNWQGIHITRTEGHHGLGYVETQMGKVSGFVLQAPNEPTVYWAGDTVLCPEVEQAIERYNPDVIVTHSCGAKWADNQGGRQLIVMDDAQTSSVCQAAPHSIVIATHMEALDHATVSREQLRMTANDAGVSTSQLRIPTDGESIEISSE
ncbi:MAG: MBL fold metallo-hydrolase [Anaerolineaceae bacterium]|nr:MBL fold metallo-hydrolase [Anaerolineaceae bacterium]